VKPLGFQKQDLEQEVSSQQLFFGTCLIFLNGTGLTIISSFCQRQQRLQRQLHQLSDAWYHIWSGFAFCL
jgi:hypothetical protein